MREIRTRFAVPGTDLHPWTGAYDAGYLASLEVYRMEILADETATIVARFTGDPEQVRSYLVDIEGVIDTAMAAADGELFYAHFEPDRVVRRLMAARRETALAMQMPLRLNEDGSVTGTFYGDEATFDEAMDLIPATVEVEIEHIRDVTGADRSVFDRLTDRQREVLDVAVAAGYYDDPRGATHADLAEQLDVSPTTVSEHLRRIERRVFAAYDEGGA